MWIYCACMKQLLKFAIAWCCCCCFCCYVFVIVHALALLCQLHFFREWLCVFIYIYTHWLNHSNNNWETENHALTACSPLAIAYCCCFLSKSILYIDGNWLDILRFVGVAIVVVVVFVVIFIVVCCCFYFRYLFMVPLRLYCMQVNGIPCHNHSKHLYLIYSQILMECWTLNCSYSF